jgi:hypothetical protein
LRPQDAYLRAPSHVPRCLFDGSARRLGVAVEQEHERLRGRPDSGIYPTGESSVLGLSHELDGRELAANRVDATVTAVVVDNDQLELVCGSFTWLRETRQQA